MANRFWVPPIERRPGDVKTHVDALSLDTVRSDYALRDMRGIDFFAYNLADIQNLRSLARLLQLECQLAVADGRFQDALEALGDGYRIAELALRSGEGTIVSQLVSIAIVGLMNAEVQLMAQKTGSPNLYWALASLPSEQLFSIRLDGSVQALERMNTSVERILAALTHQGSEMITLEE